MDFFESQDKAHKRTKLLVLMYILCIAFIVICINFIVFFSYDLFLSGEFSSNYKNNRKKFKQPDSIVEKLEASAGMLGTASLCTVGFILIVSLIKRLEMRGGGGTVAKAVGGRKVDMLTKNRVEARLVNVVEEMAIAAGTPVPEIYILDEESSINAFAAGDNPSNAAVAVSRGALKHLNRSELQGVIAHEFSHILNGDMLLNMRLIAFLSGVLAIWIAGRVALRIGYHVTYGSSRNRDGSAVIVFILFIGLGLTIVGSIGYLASFLLKSAVSRQREYLADASAVQFTRDPSSIANVLKKIGGFSRKSHIMNPKAEGINHMFFAEGIKPFMHLSSTHPPLAKRILAIEPSWDGKFISITKSESIWLSDGIEAGKAESDTTANLAGTSGFAPSKPKADENLEKKLSLVERNPDFNSGEYIYKKLPYALVAYAHAEIHAQALVISLLLAQDDELRKHEQKFIQKQFGKKLLEQVKHYWQELFSLNSAQKLALVDICLPALRSMASEDYDDFRELLVKIIMSDENVNLFEFTLFKIVQRHLDINFNKRKPSKVKYWRLHSLANEINILLSTISALGKSNAKQIESAFSAGAKALAKNGFHPNLLTAEHCTIAHIDSALDKLELAGNIVKKNLLNACEASALSDGILQDEEAELLRAISDTIGTPIPPILYASL